MKVKTSDLEGLALDWAVAAALYPKSYFSGDRFRVRAIVDGEEETIGSIFLSDRSSITTGWKPSTDWSQGGPLIDANKICIIVDHRFQPSPWRAALPDQYFHQSGPTPLIAACQAIVSAKLGDEVDVPEELL